MEILHEGHRFFYDEEHHQYFIDGQRVPGTSTVAKIRDHSRPMAYWSTEMTVDYLRRHLEFQDGKLYHVDTGDDGTSKPRYVPFDEDNLSNILRRAKNEHERFKQAAADRGTRLHAACHNYCLNAPYSVEEDIQSQFNDFLNWAAAFQLRPLYAERMVFSVNHGYAGQFDLVALLTIPNRGQVCYLIDYKSSKRVYDSHIIQCGGYKIAHDEHYGPMIEEMGVLDMPQTGAPMIWADLAGRSAEVEGAFLDCLHLYQGVKPIDAMLRKINAA